MVPTCFFFFFFFFFFFSVVFLFFVCFFLFFFRSILVGEPSLQKKGVKGHLAGGPRCPLPLKRKKRCHHLLDPNPKLLR